MSTNKKLVKAAAIAAAAGIFATVFALRLLPTAPRQVA